MSNEFNRLVVEKMNYSYASGFGRTGATALGMLPSGAIIKQVSLSNSTTVRPAGATVAFYIGTTCVSTGATAGAAKYKSGATVLYRVPTKLAADSKVYLTTTATITAGVTDLYIEYYRP